MVVVGAAVVVVVGPVVVVVGAVVVVGSVVVVVGAVAVVGSVVVGSASAGTSSIFPIPDSTRPSGSMKAKQ